MTDQPVRWLEDYVPGMRIDCGSFTVDEAAVIAFAREFDPQPFHIDPEAARRGPYGGLIASGWQTGALMMRRFAAHFLSPASSLVSPGLDEMRWVRPVRPGDVLSVRVTVLSNRPSSSRPDRGVVVSRIEVLDPQDSVVMHVQANNFILRCPAQTPGVPSHA